MHLITHWIPVSGVSLYGPYNLPISPITAACWASSASINKPFYPSWLHLKKWTIFHPSKEHILIIKGNNKANNCWFPARQIIVG